MSVLPGQFHLQLCTLSFWGFIEGSIPSYKDKEKNQKQKQKKKPHKTKQNARATACQEQPWKIPYTEGDEHDLSSGVFRGTLATQTWEPKEAFLLFQGEVVLWSKPHKLISEW